jgi:hypothetical protein
MNRPLLGIGIGLVAVGLVAGALVFAFRDDWRDDDRAVEYTVTNAQGEPTGNVVVVDGDRWRGGPGFFPFFPLIVVGGVLIVIGAVSRRGGPWQGGRRDFETWHRETHWNWGSTGPKDPPAPGGAAPTG